MFQLIQVKVQRHTLLDGVIPKCQMKSDISQVNYLNDFQSLYIAAVTRIFFNQCNSSAKIKKNRQLSTLSNFLSNSIKFT